MERWEQAAERAANAERADSFDFGVIGITGDQCDRARLRLADDSVDLKHERAGSVYIGKTFGPDIAQGFFFNAVCADHDLIAALAFFRCGNIVYAFGLQIFHKLLIMYDGAEGADFFAVLNQFIDKVYCSVHSKAKACCFGKFNLPHAVPPPTVQRYDP